MPDLKPCPFCGKNDPEIEHLEGTILHPAYVVKCGHCGAQAPWSDKGDHVDKWNQRTPGQAFFSQCLFHGPGPEGFADWFHWLEAPVKMGAFIRAATAADWKRTEDARRAPEALGERTQSDADKRLHALVEEAISWLETGGGRADSLCADLRKALAAQKDGGTDAI